MAYNHGKNTTIQKNEGFHLERATDLKYLGALMESSEKDVKGRKAAAWQSCDKLSKSGSHLCQKRLNYAYLLLLRNQYFCVVGRLGQLPQDFQKISMVAAPDF